MKNTLIVLGLASLLVACNKPEKPAVDVAVSTELSVASNVVSARIGQTIVDSTNKKYKKITDEFVSTNGINNIDIWERIDPATRQYWYTPSLSSKIFTNNPPDFNSIYRLPDENFPIFY